MNLSILIGSQQMRELRHDNVNPFIGSCIDAPFILIVTVYCSKGSLQVRKIISKLFVLPLTLDRLSVTLCFQVF